MSLEGKSQQEVAALAALSDSLLADPKTRGQFQRLVKVAKPGVSLPEIELEDKVAAAIRPLQDTNAQLVAEAEKGRMQRAADALYEELREGKVVGTRSEFAELVKYAAKEGFQTNASGLTKAARHKAAEAEVAEPTPSNLGLENIKPGKGDENLLTNPSNWARTTAAQALADLAKARAGR